MVELNHNVVSFNSDTLIKGSHGVLVAVFVTKKGSGSNKIEFRNHMFAVDSSMSFNRYLQAFISPYDKSNFTFLDILY